MENSGQFNDNHHSYRKLHSTVMAMLQLSDAIFEGCDENRITTLVMFDQSAVFDVIEHNILMRKLALYNFGADALKWIDSYLRHRSHFVSIGTSESRYTNTTSGVPQGSVLGPILYVIYVNELPALMNESNCEDTVHSGTQKLFTKNCKKCGQMPTYADNSTLVLTTSN